MNMIKKIILGLALLVLVAPVAAQEINWVTLEEAVVLQKKEPRKIFMDAYTNWCGPCKMLDKNTFHNKDVVDFVNANYYAVKFNAEGNDVINFKDKTYANPNYNESLKNRRNSQHELSGFLGIRAYPTLVFLDENANFISPLPGYKTPAQLEVYLKLFKDDTYKKIKTQEEFQAYLNAFKPTFKNS